jgi:hypothetical protein
MNRTLNYAAIACTLAIAPAALAEDSTCYTASKVVTKAVTAKPGDVLAIVGKQSAASPDCACEIVKAAIVATEADKSLVGQIVAAAIEAAPDKLTVITTCAIAVAPDALAEIRAVVATLLGSAEAWKLGIGAKGGLADPKDAKETLPPAVRNPLDGPYLIPGLPPIHPPLVSTCTPAEFPNIEIID